MREDCLDTETPEEAPFNAAGGRDGDDVTGILLPEASGKSGDLLNGLRSGNTLSTGLAGIVDNTPPPFEMMLLDRWW